MQNLTYVIAFHFLFHFWHSKFHTQKCKILVCTSHYSVRKINMPVSVTLILPIRLLCEQLYLSKAIDKAKTLTSVIMQKSFKTFKPVLYWRTGLEILKKPFSPLLPLLEQGACLPTKLVKNVKYLILSERSLRWISRNIST